jgi:long-subunit acyl-CoA synthetase (AMP-forming)
MVALRVDPFSISSQEQKNISLVTDKEELTYGQLAASVEEREQQLSLLPPGLMVLAIKPTIESVVNYLAALSNNRPLVLVDSNSDHKTAAWIFKNYDPAVIFGLEEKPTAFKESNNFFVRQPSKVVSTPCLCLTTSGSTGSPKLVRLSYSALTANAKSIAISLEIDDSERAITSLPLSYSYGLSVLNSHLISGARIILTDESIISREFWSEFDRHGGTTFAGVPYSYHLLKRLRFSPDKHPSLKTMTQAGGMLDIHSRKYFHKVLSESRKKFVIMYGQTEATARMSVLSHNEFIGHESSAGKAIPFGSFEIKRDRSTTDKNSNEGEIIYLGPNVMDCYVSESDDFDRTPELHGKLETGDRGYLDDDNFLYITGREKRIGKIHGTRLNLDDIENQIRAEGFVCAVVSINDSLQFFFEKIPVHPFDQKSLAGRYELHSSVVKINEMDSLPLLSNGKIDYSLLQNL